MSSIRGVNVGGNLFDVTDSSNVAPIETTNFASRAYAKDRCFIMADGLLYRATAEIEGGDPIVINGNCKRTTLDEIISVIGKDNDLIAPTEDGATSSDDYVVGDEIVRSGILYKVISAITQGDAFAIGSNIDIAGSLTSQIKVINGNEDAMLNVLGAKNLLQCNNTTQTIRGITYQINSDGSISTSGSVDSGYDYSFFHVNESQKLPKGKYILSGCYPNGSVDKWRLYVGVNGTNYIDYGEGVEFELDEDATIDAVIRIESGYVSDGMTFYPMIRPYNIADDSYVPYCMTNIQLTKRIAIVEGTTPATTTDSNTIVNFPDGFTRDNSMIISIGVYNNNAYRYEDKNYGVSAVMTSSDIQVFARETFGCGKDFRLMLMKIV